MIRILRRNFGYKFLSLLIAGLLYYVAYTQKNPQQSRDFVVAPKAINLPPNMILKSPPRNSIITLTGPASVIDALSTRSVQATIDLSQAQIGKNRLPITYQLPEGVRHRVEMDAENAQIAEIVLGKRERVQFGVDVIYPNAPPAGFRYTDAVAEPHQVDVIGLPEDLGHVARIVALVDTTDESGAIDRTVTLVPQDMKKRSVDTVEIEPSEVRVRIDLKPAPVKKKLLLSFQQEGEPAPGFVLYNYTFTPPQVTVQGPQEELANRSSVVVTGDVTGLTKTTTRRVRVIPPAGLKIVDSADVQVRLEIRPVSTQPAPPPETAAPVSPPAAGSGTAPKP